MEKLLNEFKILNEELNGIVRKYNPQNLNLKFSPIGKVDAELFSSLAELGDHGLGKVRQNYEYFGTHPLDIIGNYWNDFFIAVKASSLKVRDDKLQPHIPTVYYKELLTILVSMLQYSTTFGGDVLKRNEEALGDVLYTFYSNDAVELIRNKSREINSAKVTSAVEYIIDRVESITPK